MMKTSTKLMAILATCVAMLAALNAPSSTDPIGWYGAALGWLIVAYNDWFYGKMMVDKVKV